MTSGSAGGFGLLVLGMHRSGTSALARLLHDAGVSVGERLLPGSEGNEAGHWEDAFAVELNDRLLAALGRRWDDVRPLPTGWQDSDAARDAHSQILRYLRTSRSRERLWAIKDPRMCLLADLWMGALREAGLPHAVILVARHPDEVAGSLAVRDGMAAGKAELLWLRHMLDAEHATRGASREVVTYDALLENPSGVLARLRRLTGVHALAATDAEAVQPGHRHHRATTPRTGDVVADAWAVFRAADGHGTLDEARLDACAASLATADALYAPVLADLARGEAELWRRTARVEAAWVELGADATGGPLTLHRRMDAVDGTLAAGFDRLSQAISDDIRRMQDEHARALVAAVEARHESEKLQERLAAALEAMSAAASQHEKDAAHQQKRIAQLEAELDIILHSRSWRLTSPLRAVARAVRGLVSSEGRRGMQRTLAGRVARMPVVPASYRQSALLRTQGSVAVTDASSDSLPAELRPVPANPDKPDVFIWAVIDWHFRMQRPQHLARGMAQQGHRVFYLSNNLVDSPDPGFKIEPLDGNGTLFQVFLNAKGAPAIYGGCPSTDTTAQLRRSVGELMQWADSDGGLCIVQHPFWGEIATSVPGTAMLYDCMDHHAGFADNAPDVVAAEIRLIEQADVLVVTSEWLDRELAPHNANRVLIRNACDYAHFEKAPARRFADPHGRRVIGYYGAIAEWFDVDLVRAVAREFPGALVLLVGSDTAGVAAQLADEPNVQFTGEVPYAELPFYLHAFDVALLPFRILPLTLATNPVKVYEYLSAGIPVVAVDLPEMGQFGELVRCAADAGSFTAQVCQALQENDLALRERRRRFASEQTWEHRARELDAALATMPQPRVSVIVLTYNNLAFTQECLRSIAEADSWSNLEVIVVDNASSDGTQAYLESWAAEAPGRRVILNRDNVGFAAGNNVGLAAAQGDYLILLNNDTYVTPGWIRTLVNHLARHPDIGVIGPVTNNIGNEARIDIRYTDMAEMRRAAAAYTRRRMGELLDVRTVAFFCAAMRRSTYERVGPLDETFGVGFFEDDDYCRRVQAEGLRAVVADDVFVHHHLSASFDALKAEKKKELFDRNKAIYEAKWGEWVAHTYRAGDRPPG